MALFKKATQKAARNIEANRWDLVRHRMTNGEDPIVTTSAFVVAGDRVNAHAFLTDRQLLVAAISPPFGDETKPLVVGVEIDKINRLLVSDDGILVTINPDRHGNETSNVLDLFPSPYSQKLVEGLRDSWISKTGKTPEGDWSSWVGPRASQVLRSETAWARGK